MRPAVVYLEDRFVLPEQALVRLDDRGYLLGDGVFATMHARAGRCFRLGDHLARLARGAEVFGLALPISLARVGELAEEAAERTGERDAHVRVTLTRRADEATTLSILARRLDVPPEAQRSEGLRVGVAELRRPPPSCGDPFVKTTSYAGSVLARRAAVARGLDDALQLSTDGDVACGSMSNVFVVRGRALTTPPLSSGCRAGVTREVVLALARDEGLEASEANVTLDALLAADEVFLTSTRVGCLPVAEVEGRAIGRGRPFPVAQALHAALDACIGGA